MAARIISKCVTSLTPELLKQVINLPDNKNLSREEFETKTGLNSYTLNAAFTGFATPKVNLIESALNTSYKGLGLEKFKEPEIDTHEPNTYQIIKYSDCHPVVISFFKKLNSTNISKSQFRHRAKLGSQLIESWSKGVSPTIEMFGRALDIFGYRLCIIDVDEDMIVDFLSSTERRISKIKDKKLVRASGEAPLKPKTSDYLDNMEFGSFVLFDNEADIQPMIKRLVSKGYGATFKLYPEGWRVYKRKRTY